MCWSSSGKIGRQHYYHQWKNLEEDGTWTCKLTEKKRGLNRRPGDNRQQTELPLYLVMLPQTYCSLASVHFYLCLFIARAFWFDQSCSTSITIHKTSQQRKNMKHECCYLNETNVILFIFPAMCDNEESFQKVNFSTSWRFHTLTYIFIQWFSSLFKAK